MQSPHRKARVDRKRLPKLPCLGDDGLPQKSLLMVLMRRPFSMFFFSSNLEKVGSVPSLLGLNKQSYICETFQVKTESV